MKCKSCGKTYSASIGQPSPGGSSAPGVFFILAILLYALTGFLFVFHAGFWQWIAHGWIAAGLPVCMTTVGKNVLLVGT
jgi:hypothetical protein